MWDERWELEAQMTPRSDRPNIRASEMSQYLYCARSWWLQQAVGVQPISPRLREGTMAHEKVGGTVGDLVKAERLVGRLVWVLVAIGTLAFALLWVGPG